MEKYNSVKQEIVSMHDELFRFHDSSLRSKISKQDIKKIIEKYIFIEQVSQADWSEMEQLRLFREQENGFIYFKTYVFSFPF